MSILEHLVRHGANYLVELLNEKTARSEEERAKELAIEVCGWHGIPISMASGWDWYRAYLTDVEVALIHACNKLIDSQNEHLWHPCHGEVERFFEETCPCHNRVSPEQLKQQREQLKQQQRILNLVNNTTQNIDIFCLVYDPQSMRGTSEWLTYLKPGESKEERLDTFRITGECPPKKLYIHARTSDDSRTWGSEIKFRILRRSLGGIVEKATSPIPHGFWSNVFEEADGQIYVWGDKVPEVARGTSHTITFQ